MSYDEDDPVAAGVPRWEDQTPAERMRDAGKRHYDAARGEPPPRPSMRIPQLEGLSRAERRGAIARSREESRRWPRQLRQVPSEQWPQDVHPSSRKPLEMWRSRDYLVQVYEVAAGSGALLRLSVSSTHIDATEAWADGLTWDTLQRLKAEAGRGDWWACELYPPTPDVVNVANMRHLWMLEDVPGFGWAR